MRHGAAFLDTTALGKASWPAWQMHATVPSRFPWAQQADGRGKDGGDEPVVSPKPPSIQRQAMRGIMVRGMWMEGELVSPRSGLDHTQLGRAGLA